MLVEHHVGRAYEPLTVVVELTVVVDLRADDHVGRAASMPSLVGEGHGPPIPRTGMHHSGCRALRRPVGPSDARRAAP